MILQKPTTAKSIRILTGIRIILLLCCLFMAMVPIRIHAARGSNWSGEDRFRTKIYWHVDNSYDITDNACILYTYLNDTEVRNTGELNQVEDIYKGSRDGCVSNDITYMCSSKGNHTVTIDTPAPPLGFYYQIVGKGGNICKYYIDKIEVEIINPVEGTNLPTKRTLWEGSIGAKNAHVGGAKNFCRLWFDKVPPEFTNWDNDSCTDKTKRTDSCDAVFCQPPAIAGITSLKADENVNAPQDDKELSIEINPGILYDNLGARWPLQKFDITCDQEEKNIDIAYKEGKWYLVLQPDSNASEDYKVTINQHVYDGEDHPVSANVTIKTFDYNFTFINDNGDVISQQTVDYGGQVSLPAHPEGMNARYECGETADWENTTTGPKDRTIKVYYMTDSLIGSGTEEDPYLIRNNSDWECMRRDIADGETGKFYRLEENIHVEAMIGTQEKPFSGTFDGNGKTLDVSLSNNSDAVDALFAFVRAATIKNLTVTGSISGTGNYAAGLIGINLENSDSEDDKGTIINNCKVNADVTGNNYVGGFAIGYYYDNGVGEDAKLTIHKSSFTGKISANLSSGGFVAWGFKGTYLSDCLFDPESVEVSNPESASTFVDRKYGLLRDCIYTEAFGTPQGQASNDYKFIFRNSEGKKIDEQIVHEGEQPLVPVSDGNMKIKSWQCKECTDWKDTTNGILKRNVIATLGTESAFKGSGTEKAPYEIYNVDDWHSLMLRFKNFSPVGEYYRLECDLDVNETIGTQDKPFSGNFDGEMNTINITLANDNDYESTALFPYVQDAAFTYLRVTGSVTGDANRAAGLIGDNNGTTTIDNCIVSADISGTDFVGGFCSRNKKDLTITDSTYNGMLNVRYGAGFVGFDTGNYGSETSDSAHFVRCLFDPKEGSSYERGDPLAFASNADWNTCLYTAEWNDNDPYAPQRHGVPFKSSYLDGDGSESYPNLLYGHGAFGWEALRLITERESTKGVYFKQASYLMAYSRVGDSDHAFEGNYDGDGNILEVYYESTDSNFVGAPFRYVHNGTISRLSLMGYINTHRCAGMIGNSSGITRIEFCDVYTEIKGSRYVGGFVSVANGLLTIDSCNFNGIINGNELCGGFVAQGSPNTNLNSCYFTPSGTSTCGTGSTFIHMIHGDITDCYYSVPFGNVQGEQLNRGSTPDPDNREDYKALMNVVKLISKLPDPAALTLADKVKVQNARKAYDALTEEQKKELSDEFLQDLVKAEEQIGKLEKEAPIEYNRAVTAAKKLKVTKLKAKAKNGKKATITWKKNKKCDGYQIRYSTSKKFKKAVKTVKVKKAATTKKTLKKLKFKKTYYVQIRAFKKVNNQTTGKTEIFYGKWSKKAKFKTK